ncbi:hypothetical protein T492DRAFT_841081 [Pavlovales sp. CCMP2436]|nr:hypothetical protein T492DRAFT_841081 [Pavlovales sp. CCMP2436]
MANMGDVSHPRAAFVARGSSIARVTAMTRSVTPAPVPAGEDLDTSTPPSAVTAQAGADVIGVLEHAPCRLGSDAAKILDLTQMYAPAPRASRDPWRREAGIQIWMHTARNNPFGKGSTKIDALQSVDAPSVDALSPPGPRVDVRADSLVASARILPVDVLLRAATRSPTPATSGPTGPPSVRGGQAFSTSITEKQQADANGT